MALPPSGPLSISAIRTELGSSSGSLRTLSSLAGFSTPDSISEFYGYSSGYTITVYGSTQATFSNQIKIWYKFGAGGTWTAISSFSTVSPCPASLTYYITGIPSGTSVYIGVTNNADTNIRFNTSTSSVCGGNFQTYCGRTSQPSYYVTGNMSIYIGVANSGGFVTC